jgi:hypothetical protein
VSERGERESRVYCLAQTMIRLSSVSLFAGGGGLRGGFFLINMFTEVAEISENLKKKGVKQQNRYENICYKVFTPAEHIIREITHKYI